MPIALVHHADAFLGDQALADVFGVESLPQFEQAETSRVEWIDGPLFCGFGKGIFQDAVPAPQELPHGFETVPMARIQELFFHQVLADAHRAADAAADQGHGFFHQAFRRGLGGAEAEESHAAAKKTQLFGDAVAFQGNEIGMPSDQFKEEALARGRFLEHQAMVGIVAIDDDGAMRSSLDEHVGDGLHFGRRGRVAAGVAGEIEQHMDFAWHAFQGLPKPSHIESRQVGRVEGIALDAAFEPDAKDLLVVVPVKVGQQERVAGREE